MFKQKIQLAFPSLDFLPKLPEQLTWCGVGGPQQTSSRQRLPRRSSNKGNTKWETSEIPTLLPYYRPRRIILGFLDPILRAS